MPTPLTPGQDTAIDIDDYLGAVQRDLSQWDMADWEEVYWTTTSTLLQTALSEDFAIGEGIQRNFHSGAQRHQTFGKFEMAPGWYHGEIDAALASAR